jgi:hypothetical protein
MQRAGMLGAATFLAQLPALLDVKGLLAAAEAITLDVTADTLNGLLAFILPGDDEYSVAQGASANGPGAIGAGTLEPFINALDNFVPASVLGVGTTVPASGGVATVLNAYALEVNPAASGGAFLSPLARLAYAEKAGVLELFETDVAASAAVPELNFVSGILPGFIGFMACSEAGVLDPATRQPTERPVAWKITRYGGPAEGHPELKGYWQGRRKVRGGGRRHHRDGG